MSLLMKSRTAYRCWNIKANTKIQIMKIQFLKFYNSIKTLPKSIGWSFYNLYIYHHTRAKHHHRHISLSTSIIGHRPNRTNTFDPPPSLSSCFWLSSSNQIYLSNRKTSHTARTNTQSLPSNRFWLPFFKSFIHQSCIPYSQTNDISRTLTTNCILFFYKTLNITI